MSENLKDFFYLDSVLNGGKYYDLFCEFGFSCEELERKASEMSGDYKAALYDLIDEVSNLSPEEKAKRDAELDAAFEKWLMERKLA